MGIFVSKYKGVGKINVDHLKAKRRRKARGWIVTNAKTGNHAHFKSEYGCHCIKLFIREGIIPDSNYLRESYRRLTTEKKEVKLQYVNINKGAEKTYD